MTLLFIDGFEGYDKDSRYRFWDYFDSGGSGNTINNSLGRRGGQCFSVVPVFDTTYFTKNVSGIVDDFFIIGFAFYFGAGDTISRLIRMGSGASTDFIVSLVTGSKLKFSVTSLVSAVTVFTSTDSLEASTWHYLEVKVSCKNSGGKMIARLDEQELFDYTGDTKSQSSPGYVTSFGFETQAYSVVRIDDIYVCNGQGSKNNDFLGDIRIDAVHPNGAGNYAQLTPSAGNNYECIDENPYDGSDYVEGINVGDKDSYAYPDVPTELDDASIFGIQLNTQSQRTATGDNIKIKGLLRTGSTDYEDVVAQSLTDSFKSTISIWEDDPSDSNIWTQVKINACEFGMEVA